VVSSTVDRAHKGESSHLKLSRSLTAAWGSERSAAPAESRRRPPRFGQSIDRLVNRLVDHVPVAQHFSFAAAGVRVPEPDAYSPLSTSADSFTPLTPTEAKTAR